MLAGDDVTLRTLYDGKEFVLFGVGNAKLGHGVIEILAEGGPLRLPIDEVVDDGRDSVDPAEFDRRGWACRNSSPQQPHAQGKRGNLLKSGERRSKKALCPSLASSDI